MDDGYRYKVPDGCDLVQAGGLPVAFGTSHVGLVHRANLQAGQVSSNNFFYTVAGRYFMSDKHKFVFAF